MKHAIMIVHGYDLTGDRRSGVAILRSASRTRYRQFRVLPVPKTIAGFLSVAPNREKGRLIAWLVLDLGRFLAAYACGHATLRPARSCPRSRSSCTCDSPESFGQADLVRGRESRFADLHSLIARKEIRLSLAAFSLPEQAVPEQALGVEPFPVIGATPVPDLQSLAEEGLGLSPPPLLQEVPTQGG